MCLDVFVKVVQTYNPLWYGPGSGTLELCTVLRYWYLVSGKGLPRVDAYFYVWTWWE